MKTIEVYGDETVSCAILCGDKEKDATCIARAIRMCSLRTVLIGSDMLDAKQKAWHEMAKDVELYPSGTPVPTGNNVLIFKSNN